MARSPFVNCEFPRGNRVEGVLGRAHFCLFTLESNIRSEATGKPDVNWSNVSPSKAAGLLWTPGSSRDVIIAPCKQPTNVVAILAPSNFHFFFF